MGRQLSKIAPGFDWSLKAGKICRIGKEEQSKRRPIRVTFNYIEDKGRIMNNLKNLKGQSDYNGIGITDDYTESERQMLRLWVEEAKERSKTSTNFIWKVKGTPDSGLELKKFWKRKENHQLIESTEDITDEQTNS